MTEHQLAVGDVAHCLLRDVVGKHSRSGARERLRGAAAVRIEAIAGNVYKVVVLRASGGIPGERLELGRMSLYAAAGGEERAFHELVAFYWPPRGSEGRHTPPTSAPPPHPIVSARAAEQQEQRDRLRGRRREQLDLLPRGGR